MAPLTPDELQADIRQSDLVAEYGRTIDRESAHEMLAARLAKAPAAPPSPEPGRGRGGMSPAAKIGTSVIGALSTTIARSVGRELVRGVLGGLLGGKAPRGTRRTRW
jgi:hypothetical protein